MRWHRVFAVHYHSQSFTVICFLKWWLSTDQHEEDDPQTPYICKYKVHILKNQTVEDTDIITIQPMKYS